MNRFRSSFLFDRPSFLNGIARVLDISGTFNDYNHSKTSKEADRKAIYLD